VEEGFKIRLAKAAIGDPKLIYRKQVERFANHGEISQLGRRILDDLQESLSIPSEEATAIAAEVLKPFQEYQQKLQRYEQVFREAIAQQYPFTKDTRQELQHYQEILGLRERDVAPIEARLVPQSEEVTVTETTTNLNTGSEQGSNRGSIPALQNFPLQLNRPVKLMAVGSIILVLTVGGYQLLKPMLATIPISLPFASPAGFSLDKTLSPVPGIDSIAFSPDGKTLASGGYDYKITLWDLGTGKKRKTLEGHEGGIVSIAFSPDGKTLVSGSRDFTIKIWDLVTGKVIYTLNWHTNAVMSVAISPDGKTIASGSYDQTIKLWELVTGKLLATLGETPENRSYSINSVAFTPDGQTLASTAQDDKKGGTIKIWNLNTRKVLRTLEYPVPNLGDLRSLAISPNGKTIASGDDDKTIKLWNLDTGELLHTLTGHSSTVQSIAISPDGKTLASGSFDNTIKLWNLDTGKLLGTLSGHLGQVRSVAFSPNGKTLAGASAGDQGRSIITIWRR
jgi:WD40 repeat protein